MPNIKSAEKRVRVTAKQNLRNKAIKSNLKTILKKFNDAIAEQDEQKAQEMIKIAISALDKAVVKGTIHKNMANRKKAQLSKALQNIKAS